MEASGFYEAAIRYTAHHNIQIYKIISDNRQTGIAKIHKQRVIDLFYENRNALLKVMEQISTRTDPEQAYRQKLNLLMQSLKKQHHLTQYQQHRLERSFKRVIALNQIELIEAIVHTSHSVTTLIQNLDHILDQIVFGCDFVRMG